MFTYIFIYINTYNGPILKVIRDITLGYNKLSSKINVHYIIILVVRSFKFLHGSKERNVHLRYFRTQ